MTAAVPIYNRYRFPVQIQTGLCRGCHQPVPKGRKTWCGDECYDKHDPQRVRFFCFQRDKGVCSLCGLDTVKFRRRMRDFPIGINHRERRFWNGQEFLRGRFELACSILTRRRLQLYRAIENRKARLGKEGWPVRMVSWWQMDHIIPFSEGGLTVLENLRTMCCPCHKNRTKLWHKDRTVK